MSRKRVKERCFCKEENVFCRFANTNPTCIHYTGLRQCSKNCKDSHDWQHLKECHPHKSCGFQCCYRQGLKYTGNTHCSVVKENNKTILFAD